jgi:hypothetical protein
MTKHIELKTVNQGTALATSTLALPPAAVAAVLYDKLAFLLIPAELSLLVCVFDRWAPNATSSQPPCPPELAA